MTVNEKLCKNVALKPQATYVQDIRIKQGLSNISFCPLRMILYNGKLILMATSFGNNAVVVTKVHCIHIKYPVNMYHISLPVSKIYCATRILLLYNYNHYLKFHCVQVDTLRITLNQTVNISLSDGLLSKKYKVPALLLINKKQIKKLPFHHWKTENYPTMPTLFQMV